LFMSRPTGLLSLLLASPNRGSFSSYSLGRSDDGSRAANRIQDERQGDVRACRPHERQTEAETVDGQPENRRHQRIANTSEGTHYRQGACAVDVGDLIVEPGEEQLVEASMSNGLRNEHDNHEKAGPG